MGTAGGIRFAELLRYGMRSGHVITIVAKVMAEHEADGCTFYPKALDRIVAHVPKGSVVEPLKLAHELGDVMEAEEQVCPRRGIDRRGVLARGRYEPMEIDLPQSQWDR